MQIIIFNVLSAVLGITALVIPVLSSFRKGSCGYRPTVISLSAYILALVFQFFEINERVNMQDWSALADTIEAVSFTAVLFAVVIILLNVILLRIKN